MGDIALLLRLQARVATFLAELSTDQLTALAEGRASLVVQNGVSNTIATPPVPTSAAVETAALHPVAVPRARRSPKNAPIDADAVATQLRACDTLDEATERLAKLDLSANNLKLVAKVLNVPASGNKNEIAKRILNLTVGARSKLAALRQR
jgi:hypothetical protein